jgi:putative tricarboxylic transport membrane protein
MLYGLLAKAAGVEPSKLNYVVLTSGGEMLSGVMGGHVTVGTGGYSELAAQINAGKVRALAISSPERIPGIDVPTFKEKGFDVNLVNWRAVFAPKDLKAEEKQELEQAIGQMVKSEDWKAAVKQRGWNDAYMPAAEFGAFVKQEHVRAEGLFKELGLLK